MPPHNPSDRAAQRKLREEMRALGMSRSEIAAEMSRRYKLRPRAAWRTAWGWTLEEAADRYTTLRAKDTTGHITTLTGSRLSEWEHWPLSPRKPPVTSLCLLAEIYQCTPLDLIDIHDRHKLPAPDLLTLTKTTTHTPSHPPEHHPDVEAPHTTATLPAQDHTPRPQELITAAYYKTRTSTLPITERTENGQQVDVDALVMAVADESADAASAHVGRQVTTMRIEHIHKDLRRLARAAGIVPPLALLAEACPLPDPLRSFANDMSVMLEAVERREFLLGMTATVGFGSTGIMVPTFKHVDPELVPYFQQQLDGHYRADMLLGPRALISTVTAQCKLIGQLIDSADEPTRQRVAAVGTSFASFAGWLYLDAGDIAASLHWHDVAQEMAHRSRDREAVACALVDRAMARTDQGMGVAVMDLCDSALMDAGHLSPEIHVFALQQKAHGASIIGDRRQVDALLDAAARFVDQVDIEVWGVPCLRTPHYVEVNRATCYGRLGFAEEALGIWQQILPAAPSTARRDVGVWVARQAALTASLREPEWTVELAREAVKVALETGSARVRRELAAAKVTMAPWQAEPVGRNFAEVLAPISDGIKL